eukprot:9557157-Alexandrium_andersonii.AAC.1
MGNVDSDERVAEGAAPEPTEAVGLGAPAEPTKAQREQHAIAHLPFQPWRADCVAAKAQQEGHYAQQPQQRRQHPVIELDYSYFTEVDPDGTQSSCT